MLQQLAVSLGYQDLQQEYYLPCKNQATLKSIIREFLKFGIVVMVSKGVQLQSVVDFARHYSFSMYENFPKA